MTAWRVWVDGWCSEGWSVWAKYVSPNDVGATGSHQQGVHVPRRVLEGVFPELLERTAKQEKNPDIFLLTEAEDGGTLRLRVVYYNGRRLGDRGKDEARITGFGGYLRKIDIATCLMMAVSPPGETGERKAVLRLVRGEDPLEEEAEGHAVFCQPAAERRAEPTSQEESAGSDQGERAAEQPTPWTTGTDEGQAQERRDRDPVAGNEAARTDWPGGSRPMGPYPRLLRSYVEPAIRAALGGEVDGNASWDEGRVREAVSQPGVWVPGGVVDQVPVEAILRIRQGMEECWREAEHQEKTEARRRRRFDELATMWWGEQWRDVLSLRDAFDEGVWAWIASVLLIDIVKKRFPAMHVDRLHGGVRNTFRRFWVRGRALDRGADAAARWDLVRTMREDAFVQIFERSSLGANPALARAIAECWLRWAERRGPDRMEELHQRAMKYLTAELLVVSLDYLVSVGEIEALVERCYSDADRAGRAD